MSWTCIQVCHIIVLSWRVIIQLEANHSTHSHNGYLVIAFHQVLMNVQQALMIVTRTLIAPTQTHRSLAHADQVGQETETLVQVPIIYLVLG